MPPEPSAIATFAWILRHKAIAHHSGDRRVADDWLAASRAPVQIKAAIGASTTTSSDLGPYGGISISAWAAALQTQSAFFRLLGDSAFVRAPLYTRVAIDVSDPATGGVVVGEGEPIPMSPATLTNVLLTPLKTGGVIVNTNEAWRDISAAGQAHLSRQIAGKVSRAVDAAFLNLLTSTATESNASTGVTAADAWADLRAGLLVVCASGAARPYVITGPDVAVRLSTLATADGAQVFAAASPSGGEVGNMPLLVSSGCPSGALYIVNAAAIAADALPVTGDTSGEGDVLMRDDPTMPAVMTSLWQNNLTAAKAIAVFGAQVLRDDAVAVVTSINWGG